MAVLHEARNFAVVKVSDTRSLNTENMENRAVSELDELSLEIAVRSDLAQGRGCGEA
jgi:hypothetical protein